MSDPQGNYISQQKLVAALRDPRRYPHAASSVTVIETHISWVLLAGDYAYKFKKALDLGFLDYTELETRRFCCDEEIRLNRRTAPDIYLDTVCIGGSPDQPVFGLSPAFEYAVQMRRFESGRLLDLLLQQDRIEPRHIDSLAGVIAHFHANLPAVDAAARFGHATAIHALVLQNYAQLRSHLTDGADRECIAALEVSTEAEFAECRETFESRRAQGFVRECHGDLHLGNIALIGDQPVPFDCIEFDPALRWIDVMEEISFPVMDLLHRDHSALAWRLLNACLEASGDYGGVSVLRFYLAYLATVRAKVCAIRAGQAGITGQAGSGELMRCRSYLALARKCLAQYSPALIITHGLPGSGKTTFSQLALQQTGALRIRSDVERKRLFGLGSLETSRSGVGDIYSMEATQRTYARLLELARGMLARGFTVIVDAAFLRQDEREVFHRLAQSMSVPFAIASLYAGDSTLHERIRMRKNDASEADERVLEMLQSRQQSLVPHELAYTARFTTEEAPDSAANSQAWNKLARLTLALQKSPMNDPV